VSRVVRCQWDGGLEETNLDSDATLWAMTQTITVRLSCARESNARRTRESVGVSSGCAWRVDLYCASFFEVEERFAVVFDDLWSPVVVFVVDFFAREALAS
jgi:hypothetical protein